MVPVACVVLSTQVELPGDSPVFKEGQVMRKNVMEGPHKKGMLSSPCTLTSSPSLTHHH